MSSEIAADSPVEILPTAINYSGRRVTVMGLGRFGGAVGAIQFLLRHGAAVTVTDVLPTEELNESLGRIDVDALDGLHLGAHDERDFRDADLIVVNPAVRRDHPMLGVAQNAGVPLTSEMNLFWQHRPGPVIGVTGSNGKSTTTAMIHAVLQATGRNAFLGGNIGESLLPRLAEIGPDDWTVLELSSFQLNDLDRLPSSPEVAVITNFSPNHLDWHGGIEDYRRSKQAILRWQSPDGICVLNADDPEVASWCRHARCFYFGTKDAGSPGVYRTGDELLLREESGVETRVPAWTDLRVPGKHNLQNAMAAATVGVALKIPVEQIEQGLRNFIGLPHRLQFVGEWKGRRFYNDSLATTPESVFVALEAFADPVVLLAGGSDKGIDLTELAVRIARRTKATALMGETAEPLGLLIDSHRDSAKPTVQECADFHEAFRWAVEQSSRGDVVLLSPGCASFGWFRNFAERGELFMALVQELQTVGLSVSA